MHHLQRTSMTHWRFSQWRCSALASTLFYYLLPAIANNIHNLNNKKFVFLTFRTCAQLGQWYSNSTLPILRNDWHKWYMSGQYVNLSQIIDQPILPCSLPFILQPYRHANISKWTWEILKTDEKLNKMKLTILTTLWKVAFMSSMAPDSNDSM